MSTVLFCLFLNDLGDYASQWMCSGMDFDDQHGEILTYLTILILLYADDVFIFATDPTTFQQNLNVFFEYSKLCKLSINYTKTKVMIFAIRNLCYFHFHLDGNILESLIVLNTSA